MSSFTAANMLRLETLYFLWCGSIPSRLRLSSSQGVGAILRELQSGGTRIALMDQEKLEKRCHYATTHNSVDRCRASQEASLVLQSILRESPLTLEATKLVIADERD
ncbi:UDP-glucuronosyltransferase 2a1-like [Plakobranchus ocellatus]|uniref:UDP-glucuronosyltransferase 2a1-like n=1 Tax=Plakobranchus ocellatus TaxID=259542 RepID=A0AAV4DI46_9GAST|nr:UDP-glucuronosyltransferase 2a1-like [Plakobranchus ocellatus]